MADKRSVDKISLDELEAIVQRRRRVERARRFAENGESSRFRPVPVLPPEEEHDFSAPKSTDWPDRILLLIEVAAALALIAIIISSLMNLQTLNQEVAQARAGTPSSSANDGEPDLPGSSFPATDFLSELPGGSSPPDLVPPALGVRLQARAALPVPTPGPRSPTRIAIPSIGIDWPIVEGDSWEELKQGIGHRVSSSNPGERGNLVLSGHNDVYGEPFRDLEKLGPGKEVIVYAGSNAFRYVVKAKRVVLPSDLSVLAPSRNPIITLITCTPYRVDTHRLVLIGELAP